MRRGYVHWADRKSRLSSQSVRAEQHGRPAQDASHNHYEHVQPDGITDGMQQL